MHPFPQSQNFREAVSIALLRNRLSGKSPASVSELARKIRISRTATSRAINRNALPTVQQRIACSLKLPAPAAQATPARRALPANLLEQYFERSQIRLTGDRVEEIYSRKLLLFRIGDYLNAYGETAEIIAEIIGLTLCDYQGEPSTGFPSDNADAYIAQIEAAGWGVRIEEPDFGDTNAAKSAKGGAA